MCLAFYLSIGVVFIYLLFSLLGFANSVSTSHDRMVTLIRLEGDLFERLKALLLHALDLLIEHGFGGCCGINATRLDGDHAVAADLQEVLCVDADDTGLVGLGDISKDCVDHGDKHPVLVGVTGILDDGDDVGALLGHVQELAAGAGSKLNGVDSAGGADKVRDVGNSGAGRSAEVQDLGARAHPDVADTASDGCTEF